MPRKVWLATLSLVLVLAACGSAVPRAQERNPGFVPQVVDFLDDVGIGPSIALDKDGNPNIAYLGFTEVLTQEQIEAGEIPPARAATAPRLPAVLVSSQRDGIWTHTAAVQSSTQANGPKVKVTRSDQTAIAVDGEGAQHVAWTEVNGLYYNDDAAGSFPDEPQKITGGYVFGPSIAVDRDGAPTVVYIQDDGVQAATLNGKEWSKEKVASLTPCTVPDECPPDRTAMAMRPNGPIVAWTDPLTGAPMVASNVGGGWFAKTVARGMKATGIAVAVDPAGGPLVSFVTSDGDVVAASFEDGAWKKTVVDRLTSSESEGARLGTAIGIDGKGAVYVAWADPATGVHLARSSDGASFRPVPTVLTETGESPTMQVSRDGKVFLAWFDREEEDLLMGTYPEREVGMLAQPSPSGPASGPAPSGGGGEECPKGAVTEVAPPNALADGFQKTTLSAPAGKSFPLCFQNQDPVQHNVTVYQSEGDAPPNGNGQPVAETQTITGPASDTVTVDALQPNDYFFVCTIHPTTMTGTLTAK